jgi:galactokinase
MNDSREILSRAPGRVCLFGEHQDYLGLPVIAAAINRYILFSATPNDSGKFRFSMPDIGESREIAINEPFERLQLRDYLGSVLKVARRYGCFPRQGYDIQITGDIPINAGASSSSALTVAWAQLLFRLFGVENEITPGFLARFAHQAEVVEHREPGGMMDHFAICFGNVLLIDAGNDSPPEILSRRLEGLILADSRTPKKTLDVLAGTKQNVLKALDVLKKQAPEFRLRDITPDQISLYSERLPENLAQYFTAAVLNHHYTQQALDEFGKPQPDMAKIGEWMNRHHHVLKTFLKITVPKIDRMIEAALEAGAAGAKINGSGGGGTIVAIAPRREDAVIAALRKTGAKVFSVQVDGGATIL